VNLNPLIVVAGSWLFSKFGVPYLTAQGTSILTASGKVNIPIQQPEYLVDEGGNLIKGPATLKLTSFDAPLTIDGSTRLLSVENFNKISSGQTEDVTFFKIKNDFNKVSAITKVDSLNPWYISWIDKPELQIFNQTYQVVVPAFSGAYKEVTLYPLGSIDNLPGIVIAEAPVEVIPNTTSWYIANDNSISLTDRIFLVLVEGNFQAYFRLPHRERGVLESCRYIDIGYYNCVTSGNSSLGFYPTSVAFNTSLSVSRTSSVVTDPVYEYDVHLAVALVDSANRHKNVTLSANGFY